jgi:hypothetical protein
MSAKRRSHQQVMWHSMTRRLVTQRLPIVAGLRCNIWQRDDCNDCCDASSTVMADANATNIVLQFVCCNLWHCATTRVLQFANFLFIYLYFMLHPTARVFEAKASTWESVCLCAKKRKREWEKKKKTSPRCHSPNLGFISWQKCNSASFFRQQQ